MFAIQFEQQPGAMRTAADYRRAIDCAIRTEVLPHLARGRPNLVVFDEDIGLETIAIGPRGAAARALLARGVAACAGQASPCATLAALDAIDAGYAPRPGLPRRALSRSSAPQLGRSFVAATDEFVRVFMTTMAAEARRYRIYVIASNTQAPFRVSRDPGGDRRAGRSGHRRGRGRSTRPPRASPTTRPSCGGRGSCTAAGRRRWPNLIADNYKVPLTSFEQALGFAPGPARGAAARANLRPVRSPARGARLGLATSLPAFQYGPGRGIRACDDVAATYMRCLNRLGANVLIQADANDGQWTGVDGRRAVAAAVVDGLGLPGGQRSRASASPTLSTRSWSATSPIRRSTVRARSSSGAAPAAAAPTSATSGSSPGRTCRATAATPGASPSSWRWPRGWPAAREPRLRGVGQALAAGTGGVRYVQTAVIADLPFPADRRRPGCLVAGR